MRWNKLCASGAARSGSQRTGSPSTSTTSGPPSAAYSATPGAGTDEQPATLHKRHPSEASRVACHRDGLTVRTSWAQVRWNVRMRQPQEYCHRTGLRMQTSGPRHRGFQLQSAADDTECEKIKVKLSTTKYNHPETLAVLCCSLTFKARHTIL